MFARMRAALACGLVAALVGSLAPAQGGPTRTRRARVAVRYIVSQQRDNGAIVAFSPIGSTADAILSMVAARRAPGAIDDALDFLRRKTKRDKLDTVGEVSKVAMAAVAAGRNPRRFGRHNLIREVKEAQQPDGRYRLDPLDGVFAHALAMLALDAAGADVPANAGTWLANAQCEDGGWPFGEPAAPGDDEHCGSGSEDFDTSNTDTTALALQAREVLDVQPVIRDAFAYLDARRDPDKGGWGFDHNFTLTNTNSTALVIQAHAATERPLPDGAMKALKRLQFRLCGKNAGAFPFTWTDPEGDGAFNKKDAPNLGATIGGVLGLLKKPLPIAATDVTKPAPRRHACG